MDTIFGQTQPAELFSLKNVLLILKVKKYFDSGEILPAPDVPDRGSKMDISRWVNNEDQEQDSDYRPELGKR